MGRHLDRIKMNEMANKLANTVANNPVGVENGVAVDCNCEQEHTLFNERLEAIEKRLDEIQATIEDIVKSLTGLQTDGVSENTENTKQTNNKQTKNKAKNTKTEE